MFISSIRYWCGNYILTEVEHFGSFYLKFLFTPLYGLNQGGWGKKNGNIILPISPKLLLITQIGSNLSINQLDYSEHWSKFFRKIIIEHAHRYVYAIEPQKGMLAINPRRIDAFLFESEKSIMAGWHEEQMEAEAQLR